MATGLVMGLDMDTFDEARKMVDLLSGAVDVFKIGSILYTCEGRKIVDYIHGKGGEVFLDLKFHDIPNTVKGASRVAAEMGVKMFTIHLLGGREMVSYALEGVKEGMERSGKKEGSLALGVTVLTSTNDAGLKEDLQVGLSVSEMVLHLAGMGYGQGLRGFVCSPHEITEMRKRFPEAVLVTPGIRPAGNDTGDQKRVMTPSEAKKLGADYIVVGRPVYAAENPRAAAEAIQAELRD